MSAKKTAKPKRALKKITLTWSVTEERYAELERIAKEWKAPSLEAHLKSLITDKLGLVEIA